MGLAEFEKIVRQYGLEYFNLYLSIYRGTVVDNQDPEFLGRLKINVPQIHGQDVPNYWVPSKGIPGGSNVAMWLLPKVGDAIWVSFEQGNPNFPVWEYGSMTEAVTEAAQQKNNYVFQSSKGQRVELDDEKETVTITNKSGYQIQMKKDGIVIGKGNETLGKTVEDLITQINAIVVNTPAGPSDPQGPVNKTFIEAIGKRIKTILGNAFN